MQRGNPVVNINLDNNLLILCNAIHVFQEIWIFVLDTLNFCFTTAEKKAKVTVQNYSGYYALIAAIKRAIDVGEPIIDAKYYTHITEQKLQEIFETDDAISEIPFLRWRIIIDHFLRDYPCKHAKDFEHIPFHRVQTIFY